MMKRANSYRRGFTIVLLSLLVLADLLKAAPDTRVFQQGDLLLYFRNPAGSVNNGRVVVFGLGSTWDVFRRAATPTDPTFGTVIPLGNINTFLSSSTASGGYGSDWTSLSSTIWVGAVGQHGPDNTGMGTVNGDYARTVYVSKARLGAGDYGQANSELLTTLPGGTATQASLSSQIGGSGGPFIGSSTPVSQTEEFAATIPDNNQIGDNGYTLYEGGLMAQVSSTTYSYGAITGVVAALDIFRQTPVLNASGWQNINNIEGVVAREGYYLGTITISSNGAVNFVARQPEAVISLAGDLTGMTTTQGVASDHKNLTITATNLGASNLEIKMPAGFEVSTNGDTGYAADGTIAPTSGGVNATVRVRIAASAAIGSLSGEVSVRAGSGSPVTKEISGTVGAPAPSVAISGTLSGFVTTAGTASAAQTFSVSGSDLTGDLNVTAPPGYELRRAGSGAYASSASISPVNGTVAAASIEIRIAASAAAGLLNGTVNVSSSGTTSATLSVFGTVNAAPSLTVSPASLSGFSATQGSASAAQTFTVSGANLTGNVTVNAPTGFELSSGGSSYAGSLTLTPSAGTLASASITVRLTAVNVGSPSGNITVSSIGASNKTVAVSGTVVPPPSITVTGTLASFTATQGTASTAQTFSVSGANLTDNLTVIAPANFEVSTDGTNFFTSRTLTQSGGSVASTTISVRIAATAPNGSVGGNVRISSAGATERTLPAAGVVGSQPAIIAVSNFSPFTATQGTASAAQTFTVSGANLTGNVTLTAPANFEVSTDGTSFADSRSLTVSGGSLGATTVSVRIKATAPAGAVSGNITVSSIGATGQTVAVSGTVVPPPSITTTGTLAAFTTTAGTASAPQTFTVSGANLTGDVTVTAPSGFEVSNGGASYAGSLTLTPSTGTLASTTVSVRLSAAASVGSPSGSISVTSSGASIKTVGVTGTVVPQPSLATSGTLTPFSATEASASTSQSFTVTGSNLTGNVTVTAPANFEVSTDGANFFATRTLTPGSGSISATISVRLSASASPGTVSGDVAVTAAGATGRTVAVTGTVTPRPRLDVTGSFTSFSTSANVASSEQTVLVSGSRLTGSITVTAPARFEVSLGGGAAFSSSVTVVPSSGSVVNRSLFVRLAAAPVGSYAGDLTLSSPGATTLAVAMSGVVTPPPAITATGDFASFTTTVGTPSTRQSFAVSGANLSADLSISAPSGYEVSSDGTTYAANVTVARQGSSASATLFTRISGATPVGSPSGVITVSSAGATSRTLPVSGQVVPVPSLTLSGNLSPLATTVGTASASRTFNVAGANLAGNVSVTAPRGFEVAGQGKAFAPSISLSPSRGALNEQIMIRIGRSAAIGTLSGKVTVASGGAPARELAVQGIVAALPTVTLSGAPAAFSAARNRPSASQAVKVSGSSLGAVLSLTAPTGFQVSLDNRNFVARVQISPSHGTVSSRNLWIRLAPSARAFSFSGNVTASSTGASTKVIRVSGTVR